MHKFLTVCVLIVVLYPLAAQDRPVVAVLDFAKEGVSEQEMRSIISLMTSALFRTDKYDVIDVAQRDALLTEIEFSVSDCTDENCQIEMGKMLSAEYVVVGSLGKVGTRWVLAAKMLQTQSAKTTSTADGVYKDLDELVEGMSVFVTQLTGGKGGAPVTRRAVVVNWRPILAGGLVAVGAGALGVGGYFLYIAAEYHSDMVTPAKTEYLDRVVGTDAEFAALYEAYRSAYAAFASILWPGVGLAGAGVGLATVGVVLFATGKPRTEVPEVSLTIGPSGPGQPLSVGVSVKRWLP